MLDSKTVPAVAGNSPPLHCSEKNSCKDSKDVQENVFDVEENGSFASCVESYNNPPDVLLLVRLLSVAG